MLARVTKHMGQKIDEYSQQTLDAGMLAIAVRKPRSLLTCAVISQITADHKN